MGNKCKMPLQMIEQSVPLQRLTSLTKDSLSVARAAARNIKRAAGDRPRENQAKRPDPAGAQVSHQTGRRCGGMQSQPAAISTLPAFAAPAGAAVVAAAVSQHARQPQLEPPATALTAAEAKS